MLGLRNPADEMEPEGSKILQENPQNQLTWAYRSSKRLNPEPENLHGTDLHSLHMHDSCVVWFSSGTPNSGGKGFL